MPSGATCLATSPACAIQAMKWGTRAYSAQFHIEVEDDTVTNWADIPEYRSALDTAMGENATGRLAADVSKHMTQIQRHGRTALHQLDANVCAGAMINCLLTVDQVSARKKTSVWLCAPLSFMEMA